MTDAVDDAALFDAHLDATTTPDVAAIARAVRAMLMDEFPGAIEWFDGGNGLLAIGSRRAMRDLLFAIIPHRAHVNLQLADGVDLADPTGIVEGTGKRVRHVKIRSVEGAAAPAVRDVVRAAIAYRA